MGGLWPINSISSLPLLFPHTFHLIQWGSFNRLQCEYLLHHGLHTLCGGVLCLEHFFLLLLHWSWCYRLFLTILILSLVCLHVILPFLKYNFTEMAPVRDSAVPAGGLLWSCCGLSWCSPYSLLAEARVQSPYSKPCHSYPIHQVSFWWFLFCFFF